MTESSPGSTGAIRWLVRLADLQRSLLVLLFGIAGPRAAYGFMSLLGRFLYFLLDPLRILSEAQCYGALQARHSRKQCERIAGAAFEHRLWNLADLLMAQRYLRHPRPHVLGTIPDEQVERLRAAQRARQPLILLTAYYGSYDLLPIFLGHHGLHAHVLYRPHPNANYDRLRQTVRRIGGCEFVSTDDAVAELPGLLERGETVAIVGDHQGGRNDIEASFLGLPTRAIKSVALLACQYNAGIVVAGLQREDRSFRFRVVVRDIFDASSWEHEDDPLRYVTHRYLRGLEEIVLSDPT